MMDYKLANSLASEALKLWGSGQLTEASDRYQREIEISRPMQIGMDAMRVFFSKWAETKKPPRNTKRC